MMSPRILLFSLLPAAAFAQVEPPPAPVERVHVVEKRPFTESGRTELTIFGPVQSNCASTGPPAGPAGPASLLRRNLPVQAGGTWFPPAGRGGPTGGLRPRRGRAP